tara:strand:- start:5888 stop:6937 length:1050 start_codon:yes stop_codon:yes gene_type:complete
MSSTDYVSKGVLPGYLQSDPSCNSNLISSINDEFNRLQNSKNLSLRFKLFSPYTNSTLDDPNATRNNITQEQLNMRRKAEILKYKKNTTGGVPTSKQNFARLMRGTKNVQTQFANCLSNESISMPTTSSDVPGPVISLQLDNSIPLYNYESNRNVYSLTNETENFNWNYFADFNINTPIDTFTKLYSLTIGQENPNTTNFNFNFPLGINIEGDLSNNNTCDVSLNSFDLKVFFNNSEVSTTFTNNFSDLSGNLSFTIPSITSEQSKFQIAQYLFNINIENLNLPTEYGFVYEIKCKFGISIQFANTPTNLTSKVIMNINQNQANNVDNILFNGYSLNNINPFYIYTNTI